MKTGQDLIELGFTPNKTFKSALEYINQHDLIDDKEIIDYMNSLQPVYKELYKVPVSFHRNIKAENNTEVENINKVVDTMNQIMVTPTILNGCIMPDACPTREGEIPVGSVIVTENAIHPGFHSADICCSLMMTNLGKIPHRNVMDISYTTTQFGQGGRKEHGGWENLLYDNKNFVELIESNYYTKDYLVKAAKHLGTQGDGNHFLYVGTLKSTGDTVLVTHHGSRGFGASVYKKGMATAEKFRKDISPQTDKKSAWIPYNELEGLLYWEALQIIREWTKLNHESIHNKICNKLKLQYLDRFWNEHNFVFKDENLFYHAKGATPLSNKFVPDSIDGLRLIPLNMKEPILIVKGETNETNLGFAPHGAGRNISRNTHKKGNIKEDIKDIFNKETKGLDVRFAAGGIDISELPSAYKDAKSVKKQIEEFNLGEIVDEIFPFGCIMAGTQNRIK